MAGQDPLQMLKSVIDDVRADANRVIGPAPLLKTDEPPAFVAARDALAVVFASWDRLSAALDNAGGRIALLVHDPRYAPAERDRQVADAIVELRDLAGHEIGLMQRSIASLAAATNAGGLPTRPTGSVVEQEAVVARLERTWTRELDAVRSGEEAATVLLDALRAALAVDDRLAMWALATERSFVASTFRARGWVDDLAAFDVRVGEILDVEMTGAPQAARVVLRWLEGPQGLGNVVQTAFVYLRIALDDISAGRAA